MKLKSRGWNFVIIWFVIISIIINYYYYGIIINYWKCIAISIVIKLTQHSEK